MAEISREEKIILKMLGEQVELEPPQSRIEVLLYRLLEQGGGGGGGAAGLIVDITQNDETMRFVLNKTWNEIKAVVEAGGAVYLHDSGNNYDNYMAFRSIEFQDDTYYVRDPNWNNDYTCSNPDDYPSYYFG